MTVNDYISEHGQLSKKVLLNVAEILTLRLPEGVGEDKFLGVLWGKTWVKFYWKFGENLRQINENWVLNNSRAHHRSKMGEKIPCLQSKRFQAQSFALHPLTDEANSR